MAASRVTLRDGKQAPALAFGVGTVWFNSAGARSTTPQPLNAPLVQHVKEALGLGFHHIDNAEMYGTEREVGVALQQYMAESGTQRSDLFLTSKVSHSLPDVNGAVRRSLELLQTPYLDLYLIHTPFFQPGVELQQVWADMELLVDQGLVRSIGVSNFRLEDLQQLLTFARIKPAVNQVEFHPYLQQTALAQLAQEHGVVMASYSPLVPLVRRPGGPVDALVDALAAKYGVTAAQVLLRWNLQHGRIVVTTSRSLERLKSFLETNCGKFELAPEDVAAVDAAGAQLHFRQFFTADHGEPSPAP